MILPIVIVLLLWPSASRFSATFRFTMAGGARNMQRESRATDSDNSRALYNHRY